MKILWFSNKVFSDKDTGGTGTWLDAMAHSLVATGEVELCNIAMGSVSVPTRQAAGTIRQWIVPAAAAGRDGLPRAQIVAGIINVVKDLSPNLVHIWGQKDTRGDYCRPPHDPFYRLHEAVPFVRGMGGLAAFPIPPHQAPLR